jgi:hypothetical protein
MMKIKFTAQGANSMFGGFSSGDVANLSDALARHLVEEAKVAKYIDVPPEKSVKPARKAKSAAPAEVVAPVAPAEDGASIPLAQISKE